jgi:hypothetical protein
MIIQRWNGYRPAINWLLSDFRRYLIQEKINDMFKGTMLQRKRSRYVYPIHHTTTTTSHSIHWIDSLLETPIEDHRKYSVWRIVAPYLINIRKLSHMEAFNIIRDWLNRCSKIRPVDFNVDHRIKDNLRSAIKVGNRYLPVSFNNLKVENPELHEYMLRKIKTPKTSLVSYVLAKIWHREKDRQIKDRIRDVLY